MANPNVQVPARYEVLQELGRGGFGLVVRARDKKLDREVALKFLLSTTKPTVLDRFEREARVLAMLDHPHILRVFDGGRAGPYPYLVTELLEGKDLSETTPGDPLALMMDIASGLQAIHDVDLVHRDVKPANILLTRQGRAVLLDMGLVGGESLDDLTATGMVVGTPAFMSPELLAGKAATPQSDWYAWGVTLKYLLDKTRTDEGRRLVTACLSPDRDERPASLRDLELLLDTEERTRAVPALALASTPVAVDRVASRTWLALPALGALLLAAFLGTRAAPPRPPPPTLVSAPRLEPPPQLGAKLRTELARELEAADALELTLPGEGGRVRLMSFIDALSIHGIGTLDELPRHMKVLDWFVAGGDVATLAPAEVEVLREHDRALMDVGCPPPFAPFLELVPRGEPVDLDDAPPEVRRILAVPAGRLSHRQLGWLHAAGAHLRDAVRHREAATRAIQEHPANRGTMALFVDHPDRPGEAIAIRMRGDAAGRDALRDILGPGEHAARLYLLAARRTLDGEGASGTLASTLRWAFEEISILFLGRMLSASRDRLFGPLPRSPAAASFEADVLKHIRILRDRSLVPHGPLDREEVEARRRAVAMIEAAGETQRLPHEVADLILRLDAFGEDEEVEALYTRYRPLLGDLGKIRHDKLERLVARRGFDPPG